MLERQSAIAHGLAKGGRDGADGQRRLKLGEQRGWSLIQLGAFATSLAQLDQAAAALLGAALPTTVGEAIGAGQRQLLKTGPEQFWILGPAADDLAARLQGTIDPSVGAVTPLSHSRTRIIVEGAPARELLIQGIPLDLHRLVFREGQFALTGLHHTPVLLLRSAQDRYEIFAMRTFALSVWEWLTDAALRWGYEITA
jgi:heterotetrameric sarcosine oxidase gamma subunit